MYLWKKPRKVKVPGKVRPPSPYKAAMTLLDKVFSAYIRNRDNRIYLGVCPICGRREIEVCFHFFPRKNMALRWEPDNCVGSCSGCNYEEHMRRGVAASDGKFSQDHIRIVGAQRYSELEALKGQPFKKSAAELVDMVAHFKALMAGGR